MTAMLSSSRRRSSRGRRPMHTYQHAKQHSDKQNARIEHDKAVARVITAVLTPLLAELREYRLLDDAGDRPRLADELQCDVGGRGKGRVVISKSGVAVAKRAGGGRDGFAIPFEHQIGERVFC